MQKLLHTPSPLIPTVVGGFLSGLCGLLTGLLLNRKQRKHQKETEDELRDGVYAAMQHEADAVDAIYARTLGGSINKIRDKLEDLEAGTVKPGKNESFSLGIRDKEGARQAYFKRHAPLSEDWFPIFDKNAQYVGKFEETLRRRLLEFHAAAKDLIETFRLNNEYLKEMRDALIARSCVDASQPSYALATKHVSDGYNLLHRNWLAINAAHKKYIDKYYAFVGEPSRCSDRAA